MNILLEDGLENAISKISAQLVNAAMFLERITDILTDPNKRTIEGINGYTNGFKPRPFQTAMGKLQLAIPLPQVREVDALLRATDAGFVCARCSRRNPLGSRGNPAARIPNTPCKARP